jgi:hypothetical protein
MSGSLQRNKDKESTLSGNALASAHCKAKRHVVPNEQ